MMMGLSIFGDSWSRQRDQAYSQREGMEVFPSIKLDAPIPNQLIYGSLMQLLLGSKYDLRSPFT